MRQPGSCVTDTPTPELAAWILTAHVGGAVRRIQRFPTGLAHYVYDAQLTDGRQYVVRLTLPAARAEFEGALYWSKRLRPLGVQLPRLLRCDLDGGTHGFPALVMERLPGTDLGEVYATLSDQQKRQLAREIVAIQRMVAKLPAGQGFGYAHSYEDPTLKPTWKDVVDASLERSRQRIRAGGVVDLEAVARVQAAVDAAAAYFSTIEPTCFLHDTTTKNVLVADGRLSGIVDVDSVCFGDPLFTPALTQMALLSLGYDTRYVDAWAAELALEETQRNALTLYTAVHCVGFLSELGQAFNRDQPVPVEAERVQQLLSILDRLLNELAR